MLRRSLLCLLFAGVALFTWQAFAQKPATMNWIWFDEGDPLSSAPAETRYFRRGFAIEKEVAKASLEITADNRFTVWVNGKQVGSGDTWSTLNRYDVTKH